MTSLLHTARRVRAALNPPHATETPDGAWLAGLLFGAVAYIMVLL